MGICRQPDEAQIDFIKEMAEALGTTGMKLERILEEAENMRMRLDELVLSLDGVSTGEPVPSRAQVNDSIRQYNRLVDKAEDALRWLLIQREACGFRIHKDVEIHYPLPPRRKLLKP